MPSTLSADALVMRACTAIVPGSVYKAPGRVTAAFYNGLALGGNADALGCVVLGGTTIMLNFTAAIGDVISALATEN